MDNSIENKYLNSFTILSFNPNNIDVSFKCETLLLDDKQWNEEEDFQFNIENNDNNNNNNNNNNENENESYWIINIDGKNKILKGDINSYNINQEIIKAGPYFSKELVVFWLNYFNETGL